MVLPRVLDTFHTLAMVTMVVVPLLAPVKFIPAWLCFQIYFATRYHDYCVLTKITEIAEKYWTACDPGTAKNFTAETQDFYREKLGIDIPSRLVSNFSTTFVGLSMATSVFRLSKAYKFDFFPRDKTLFRLTMAISALFIFMEINIDLLWDTEFPRCEEDIEWTTVEEVEKARA